MNINKKLIKGTAITAAAVTVIATTGFHMVNAADVNQLGVNAGNIVQVADGTTTLSASDIDGTAFKDETVYVIADASGNTQKVIVSDWLKNFNASAGLSDYSTLSDLVNVKGDETFEAATNNALTWNAQGNDIYYQGNSESQLPVTVKVTYTLDGVEMSPEELIGKSGKLTVRYDYTNLLKQMVDINGTSEEIYTPLLMVTGAVLSTDHYRNIEVTNGKIISDGNNQMVVGISLPGLTDSLKVDEDMLTIPEYFEYTADVTDYSVGTSVSVGLTDILSDIDINGEDFSLEDIQDKIDELVDGVDQLLDGSSQLYDGLCTLQDKTVDFKEAVSTLSSSLTSLKSALSKLQSGAVTLNDGATSLATGAATLNSGLGSAKDGMDKIVSNYSAVESGVNQLSSGVKTAAAGLDSLTTNLETVNGTYETLTETVENDEAIIEALKQVNEAYKDETIAAVIAKLEANTAGQKQIATGLTDAGSKLVEGAKSLSQGASQLQTGVSSLSTGIKALSDGSTSVQSALGKLYTGSDTLLAGAKQLSSGTSSLVSNTKELASAGSKLADGGNSLLDATNQLADGIGELKDGSGELKDGIQTLKEDGVDKITDLVDGDLKNLVERFKAVVDQSKSYKNFSGIGDDMDGSVKFIIKYEDASEN